MADLDERALTNAFTQALKNRGIGGSGGGSFGGGQAPASKPADATGNVLADVAGSLKTGLGKFADEVKGSLDVWRDLSRSGANFSNDLIGLSTSAANSRMSLHDFADVVKSNNKQFAGLGGSVAKGSQAFADLSKGFFDSKMDLQLRNLAYTTKEMNEVLAIQIGNTRSSTALDEMGRKKSYESAALMAREMDMTSKLMGKSREQQMEEMKLRQTDAQVQAKIRLESQKMRSEGKTEAEIAAYKTNIMNSLQKATNEGVGQAAKEMFTTGAATSKTGQMQAGLMGGQVTAVSEEQRAIRRGDTGAAKEAAERATAEAIKAQNDPTILSLTALGDAAGEYKGVLEGSFKSLQTFNDALESVAIANKLDLNDKKQAAEAYKLAREKVEKADEEDMKKKGAGAVKGALAVERGAQEIRAGAANAANAITEGGKSIADSLNSTGKAIADSMSIIEGTNRRTSLGAQIGEAASASGKPKAPLIKGEKEGEIAFKERQQAAGGGAIGEAVNAASKLANAASDKLNAGLINIAEAVKIGPVGDPVKVQVVDIKAKAGGGFVPGPEINLIGEDGPEWVLNKEQMGKTLEDAARKGVEQASTMMPKLPSSGGTGGLNLAEMSKTITKSFSSVSGGSEKTTKQVQSPEAKKAEAQLESLSDAFSASKKKLFEQISAGLPKNASFSEKHDAFQASPVLQDVVKQYEEDAAKLRKEIADGTKWETTIKKDAAEESKALADEQFSYTRKVNSKVVEEHKNLNSDQAKLRKAELDASKTGAKETTKIKQAEVADAIKQANLSKDIIGKSVTGMSQDAIEKMIKSTGANIEDFYIDSTKKGSAVLKSFSSDYVDKLKEKDQPKAEVEVAGIPKTITTPDNKDMVKSLGKTDLDTSQKAAFAEQIKLTSAAAKENLQLIKTDISESLPIQEIAEPKPATDINTAQTAATASVLDDKKLPAADTNPYAKSNVTSDIAAGMKVANTAPEKPAMSGMNSMISSWFAPKSTDLKAAGATIPAEAKKEQLAAKQLSRSERDAADAKAAKEKEAAAAGKPAVPAGAKSESTLNDVVKSLERLNIQMGQLISQNETIGRQQTKAIKSNSANGYERSSA